MSANIRKHAYMRSFANTFCLGFFSIESEISLCFFCSVRHLRPCFQFVFKVHFCLSHQLASSLMTHERELHLVFSLLSSIFYLHVFLPILLSSPVIGNFSGVHEYKPQRLMMSEWLLGGFGILICYLRLHLLKQGDCRMLSLSSMVKFVILYQIKWWKYSWCYRWRIWKGWPSLLPCQLKLRWIHFFVGLSSTRWWKKIRHLFVMTRKRTLCPLWI